MTLRFLIDNCLTPQLAVIARAAGYEAMHLRDLRRENLKDWDLVPVINAGRWTFVTRNARDFRGPAARPGSAGQYRRLPEHDGLVCLHGPPEGTDIRMQEELFRAVVAHLKDPTQAPRSDDLASQVVEASISATDDPVIAIRRYDLPPGSWGIPDSDFSRDR